MSDSFTVQASRSVYEVSFVDDFAASLAGILQSGDVLIIDANILTLYEYQLKPVISDYHHIPIQPNEGLKSYQGVEPIIKSLIESGFRKNHRLIAIGGGITQDITAFIASILYRGVIWVFFPTTLLAQGDSCIGSKTSINFGEYKNQIGGFYPPREIIIDPGFIESLSMGDKLSGMGEMAHYYLIGGREDFDMLRNNFSAALTDPLVLRKLILRSLEIKKQMIEKDEFDTGPRNIFNYGHTFGHAIESITNYRIPHGIAVAYGMDIANYISARLGHIPDSLRKEIREFLARIWQYTEFPDLDINDYRNILMKDKKVVGKQLNCILTKGLADMFKTPLDLDETTMNWIQECFDGYRS